MESYRKELGIILHTAIKPHMLSFDINNWFSVLQTPLLQRVGYHVDENSIQFGQVTGRILGSQLAEDEYFEMLYDVVHNEMLTIHLLSEELDKSITNEIFQSIQKILMIHQEEKGLSVNRFVAFLEGEKLIPQIKNQLLYKHLRGQLINLLTIFQQKHEGGLLHPQFRRCIVDIIKWIWNHVNKWVEQNDFIEETPKVFWYGDASESEMYFLYYLMLVGCDVLIFHPEGTDIFSKIDAEQKVSTVLSYPSTTTLIPFPKTRPIRKATIAYKASKEIEKVLHSDESLLYKPWQLRSYIPYAITLKTTYDELFLIIKEKALIRPNFEVVNQTVQIPNLFAKVLGVTKNKKQYWGKIQELLDLDICYSIKSFPFTSNVKGNNQFHYKNALGDDNKLDPDKMVTSNWWKYKEFPLGFQKGLAAAISRYCANPKLITLNQESKEQLNLYLFTQAMDIPMDIVKMLQKFDYSQEIPHFILYNIENYGKFSRSDAAMLLLLNEFGADIVIFNPEGHNDIELFVNQDVYDTHWLEEMSFGEEFKEASLLKRFIKKFF